MELTVTGIFQAPNKDETMKSYRRKVFGAIDGITVYGQYYDEDGLPSAVRMQWKRW